MELDLGKCIQNQCLDRSTWKKLSSKKTSGTGNKLYAKLAYHQLDDADWKYGKSYSNCRPVKLLTRCYPITLVVSAMWASKWFWRQYHVPSSCQTCHCSAAALCNETFFCQFSEVTLVSLSHRWAASSKPAEDKHRVRWEVNTGSLPDTLLMHPVPAFLSAPSWPGDSAQGRGNPRCPAKPEPTGMA